MKLIIGTGQVGSALLRRLNTMGEDVRAYTSQQLDITNKEQVFDMVGGYTDIYIAGAYTDVDGCETDTKARKVNVEGVRNVCEAANKARVIFFSSSYVFNGEKTVAYQVGDLISPISMYGVHKALAERQVLSVDGLVVRTVGVFGRDKKQQNFAYQVLNRLNAGEMVTAIDDQWINPVHADCLAGRVLRHKDTRGVIHLAGGKPVSKYEFAVDIAKQAGFMNDCVSPIHTKDTQQKAQRPRNGCLKNTTEPIYGYYEAIQEFLNHAK